MHIITRIPRIIMHTSIHNTLHFTTLIALHAISQMHIINVYYKSLLQMHMSMHISIHITNAYFNAYNALQYKL